MTPTDALALTIANAVVSSRRDAPGAIIAAMPQDIGTALWSLTSRDAQRMRPWFSGVLRGRFNADLRPTYDARGHRVRRRV